MLSVFVDYNFLITAQNMAERGRCVLIPTETSELLEQLPQPVFLVKDETIISANHSARVRDITIGTNIFPLISIGKTEYSEFKQGKLLLTVCVNGIAYNTVVTKSGTADMFCLESEYSRPELRVLALAAQSLREPLTTSKIGIDQLLPEDAIQQSPDLRKQIQRINKSIYQLQRAIGNMGDAETCHSIYSTRLQLHNANEVVKEIVEKTNTLMQHTRRKITFDGLSTPTFCQIDREKLERALLNLISNAAKYSQEQAPIHVTLRKGSSKLYISVQSHSSIASPPLNGNIFSAFLREPTIDNSQSGIGLGLTIAHGIATAHKGTLLMEQPEENVLRFTISLALKHSSTLSLNSPLLLPINDNGGIDRALIELSDILPAEVFE